MIRCVHALKARGIHHNDLRLHNIVVDAAGKATVIDFGLAGPVEVESTKAALLHLILAAAARRNVPGEYPLGLPGADVAAIPPSLADLYGFVASGQIDTKALATI